MLPSGIYWVKQHKAGMDFFNEWLRWHPQNVGHDQDGLNNVVGGWGRGVGVDGVGGSICMRAATAPLQEHHC
jgi:hypothetical protein